ncbi:helix-turn-helix domain-containing protein [Haloferula sargassicola]|uniref:helix-turn-helix domain-containing protein n=1 Tax=Haloferula sargassicola TaxID=490096 RepID=UPI0033652FF3
MDAEEWAEELKKALPVELTKLREARGLSKNELSARTGLARSFITYLEQGRATPSIESFGRLAFALGLSPGEILKRAEKRIDPIPRFRKDARRYFGE